MFRVAGSATRPSDFVVDHRDNGVIGDAALAWTIVIQHVAGPIPAVLHATPLKIQPASRQAAPVLPSYCYEQRTADRVLPRTVGVMLSAGSANEGRRAPGIYQTAQPRASQPLISASAAATASGCVDCGVFLTLTEAAAVTRSFTSSPNRSLDCRHCSSDSDSKSLFSSSKRRTMAPTTS